MDFFTVYIIYSITIDRYYIGCTSNLEARIIRHNQKSKGYTGKVNDWKVVYKEVIQGKATQSLGI